MTEEGRVTELNEFYVGLVRWRWGVREEGIRNRKLVRGIRTKE